MRKLSCAAVVLSAAVGSAALCWAVPKRLSTERGPCVRTVEPPGPAVDAVAARTRAKRTLALQIIRHRTPLLDAAEQFRQANGPDGMNSLNASVLGCSLREKLCHQVVAFVATIESELLARDRLPWGASHATALREELARLRAAGAFVADPPVR
ncbi:MAG TPA: hypothetical protein VGE74_19365 [Gemmata sp.]